MGAHGITTMRCDWARMAEEQISSSIKVIASALSSEKPDRDNELWWLAAVEHSTKPGVRIFMTVKIEVETRVYPSRDPNIPPRSERIVWYRVMDEFAGPCCPIIPAEVEHALSNIEDVEAAFCPGKKAEFSRMWRNRMRMSR